MRLAWPRLQQRAQPDLVQRLAQEIHRYQAEEFRLEQLTAHRQIQHLLPLVERELARGLPGVTLRRTTEITRITHVTELVQLAHSLPDPETLRRQPISHS